MRALATLLPIALLALVAADPAAAAVPGCGFDECHAGNACRVLLCTTLDDAAETRAPAVGPDAADLTSFDFVTGAVGRGLRANRVGEYAAYPQIGTDAQGATVQSIENSRGTLDFWYQPLYDETDPGEYFIFTNAERELVSGNVTTKPSSLEILKHSSLGNGNSLAIIYWDGIATETLPSGVVIPKRWEFWIDPSDYELRAGVFTHLRITWDWKSSGVPLRVWQDSKELPLERADGGPAWTGPMGIAAESPNENLFICGRPGGTGGTLFQYNGVCDHVRIYDRPIAPAAVSVPPPSITSPAPGTTLPGATASFAWAANGTSVTEWWLRVGSQPGAGDYFDSGSLAGTTQIGVTGLPTDGRPVHARLFWRAGGGPWSSADFSYTAATIAVFQPAITMPAQGSVLAGVSVPFVWKANGTPATEWWLYVGSSPGANDYHDSGNLGGQTQATVGGLPGDGTPVHARLFWRTGGGTWSSRDFQYSATLLPMPGIAGPAPGSTLAGGSVPFSWAANGTSVTEWWLYAGSSPGANDYYDSGSLGGARQTTVTGLPTDGSTVHATLWWRSGSGAWASRDYPYTAKNLPVLQPAITGPTPGGTLTGPSASFRWAANGTPVTEWWLYVGSTPGADDVHDSGSLGSATQATVSQLPTNGSLVYARLFWRAGNASWASRDFTFSAAVVPPPGMVDPRPGATLSGASESFAWTSNGTPASEWWLYAGSSPGARDHHDSGSLGTATQAFVNALPTNGSPVYVRLFWRDGTGPWQHRDFLYAAAPVP